MTTQSKGLDVAKLPIKGVAQRKLEEALQKLEVEGKLKKKKKNDGSNRISNKKPNKS